MKNLIFAFLFITSFSFSQETYTFKSGGRVFENDSRLNSIEVNKKFTAQPEIIKLYNTGRNRKTFGNILLWGGIGTVVIKHLTNVKNSEIQSDGNFGKPRSNVMCFVGAGISLVAIPIKIGLQKKIKKSILLMNEQVTAQKQSIGFNFETNIIANTNGVGLKLTF